MSESIPVARFREEIGVFLEETFDKVRGIYLDHETSWFQTLGSVTAEEASGRASERSASIAAHVKHAAFYLNVLQRAMRGENVEALNWREIWENDRPVSTEEWRARIDELRGEVAALRKLLDEPATWSRPDAFGEAVATIAHSAYHLGAIRQILASVRARAPVAGRTT